MSRNDTRSVLSLCALVFLVLPLTAQDRASLGIAFKKIEPALAEHLGVKENEGVIVSHVADKRPGALAGLKRHDVIAAVNGAPVTYSGFACQVRKLKIGAPARLSVIRALKTVEVTAVVDRFLEFEVPDDEGDAKIREDWKQREEESRSRLEELSERLSEESGEKQKTDRSVRKKEREIALKIQRTTGELNRFVWETEQEQARLEERRAELEREALALKSRLEERVADLTSQLKELESEREDLTTQKTLLRSELEILSLKARTVRDRLARHRQTTDTQRIL